ncbi:hypothetical protein MSPP1_003760 [Malassezia sp. CBS 17886]|nr:hypothetical protein MSPP1_003760 [Malassezia sp. CBS 17886]
MRVWTLVLALVAIAVQITVAQSGRQSVVNGLSDVLSDASSAFNGVGSRLGRGAQSHSSPTSATQYTVPTAGRAVTVSVTDPNQKYSGAIGTIHSFGESANSGRSGFASKHFSTDKGAASSFANSMSESATKHNTQGSGGVGGGSGDDGGNGDDGDSGAMSGAHPSLLGSTAVAVAIVLGALLP